jgi:hypothetical protein
MSAAQEPLGALPLGLGRLRDPGDPAEVAAAFIAAAPLLASVPLPGAGDTASRFAVLAGVATASPALARLVEGHLDALAILAELGAPLRPDGVRLGVWAAEPGGCVVEARRRGRGWRLEGRKPYASGADQLTHALITARRGDDRLLFLVPADGWEVEPETWQAVGMAGSDSPTVTVSAAVETGALIGGVDGYLDRPGFWHGGVGVAAVWFGGALGVARALRQAGTADALSAHGLAHLGGVEVALASAEAMLDAAAAGIDADPRNHRGGARLRAMTVRAHVEHAATETLERVGRALGAGPLCHDRGHARRVADLTVYLRQSHAEGDLEAIGRLTAGLRRQAAR